MIRSEREDSDDDDDNYEDRDEQSHVALPLRCVPHVETLISGPIAGSTQTGRSYTEGMVTRSQSTEHSASGSIVLLVVDTDFGG